MATHQRCKRCGSIPYHIGIDLAGHNIYHCNRMHSILDIYGSRDYRMEPCDCGYVSSDGVFVKTDAAFIKVGEDRLGFPIIKTHHFRAI